MFRPIISLLFVVACCTCFSQEQVGDYSEAIKSYDSEDYQNALQQFQVAKKVYQNNADFLGVIKCLTYMSRINSLKSDYKTAVSISDEALAYFNNGTLKNDSLYVEIVSNKALSLKFLGEFQEAFNVNDALIGFLETKKDRTKYLAETYQIRSRIEIDLGTYDNAIQSAKKALVLNNDANIERQAALLNIVGVGFFFKEDLDSTLHYYNASYKIKQQMQADDYQMAISTYNIGIVHEDLGNYDKAIEFYGKAVQHDLADRGEEVGFLSDMYVALTNTYIKKNDLEKAQEFAEKALKMAIKKHGEDSPQTSFVYSSYSNIFEFKGDYEKAIEFLQKALKIRRKTYGEMHRWTAESHLSIAESQVLIKRFVEAEQNYKDAIAIAEAIGNNIIIAYAKMGLGDIYMQTNQLELASKSLQASKAKFVNAYGDYHATHLSVLVLEAKNYFKNNQPQKALAIIESIITNASDSNAFYHLDALTLQLDIALQSFEQNKDSELLKTIINTIDETISLILKIRKDYPSSMSKIHVNNGMNAFISKAIKAAHILYQENESSDYLETAFKLSEINKSSTLVSGIQDARFKKMAGVPDALLKFENNLNYQLGRLKQDLYYEENTEKPDGEYIDELLSKQLITRKSLDSLLIEIEKQYPKYYQLKYNDKSVSITELQKSVFDNNEILIEYFLEENNVYVFVVSKTRADFIQLSNTAETVSLIDDFRTRLKQQQDITQQSKALYNILLKDLDLQTSHLIVVPDKELNHLPFEALIKDDTYIIADYTISYSGSSSLLATQQDDFFKFKFDSNWSGFAPRYSKNSALTSNETEIKAIAKLMKGDAFLGSQASLVNFKNQTQNASILHLAMHAEIDHNNPLYNQLIFSEDTVLTASDIYTLPINADLTVLSACETGFGKLEKSEGVMSMSRAFQYAGVKSTVMSLWKVPDQETSKLMVLFYGYLKKGLQKDEALQKAKIDYLDATNDVMLKHPYYWSGFVISGDVTPIESNSSLWFIIWALVLIVFAVIGRKRLIKFFK